MFLQPTKKGKIDGHKIKTTPLKPNTTNNQLKKELKELRINLSKKHNLQPVYNVFNNETLQLIITERPTTLESLSKIKGFGLKKTELFGKEIIDFINKKGENDNVIVPKAEGELLEILINERPKIAKYNHLSEEDVYSDKVAGYLAKMKPKNKEQLTKIFGFRKENVELFGDYLLKIIAKHRYLSLRSMKTNLFANATK